MKLFILRPVEGLDAADNPWSPWYDKCFGFIIRAETEAEARKIAHENGYDENMYSCSPWLNKKYSTCTELTNYGEAGIIMLDVASA